MAKIIKKKKMRRFYAKYSLTLIGEWNDNLIVKRKIHINCDNFVYNFDRMATTFFFCSVAITTPIRTFYIIISGNFLTKFKMETTLCVRVLCIPAKGRAGKKKNRKLNK